MIAFGALLRALRLASTRPGGRVYANGPVRWQLPVSMSQNELARRALIDPAYVHRFERGDAEHPRRSVVERLAAALELDDLETARLLVAAGYWPWLELDDDATEAALAIILAVAAGDSRRLLETSADPPFTTGRSG